MDQSSISLGNVRCTSRKGFCSQLNWEILLYEISPLKTYYALEHLNISLPCERIIYSSPWLCLHKEEYTSWPHWKVWSYDLPLSMVYEQILCMPYLSRSFQCFCQHPCSCPLLWEDCVPNRDCSFNLDPRKKRNVKLNRARSSQRWSTGLETRSNVGRRF